MRATVSSEIDPMGRLSVLVADLADDRGWSEAIDGCEYVLHVASPFPSKQPKDPDELIVPAREGTLRVLRSSVEAGVKRVVLTSSIAAITGGRGDEELTEEDWTDPAASKLTPYARSKTIAERAAWDFVRDRDVVERLAVVNPGAIIGAVLNDDLSYSLQAITRLLEGMPGMPRLGFNLVDVRDVAELEVEAMTASEAGGERFIAVNEFLWMAEIGEILRQRLGDAASKVPTRSVPDLLVRMMALFDPDIRSVIGGLGKRSRLSSQKARTMLGWKPRPIEDTITETAESLIHAGVTAIPPGDLGSAKSPSRSSAAPR